MKKTAGKPKPLPGSIPRIRSKKAYNTGDVLSALRPNTAPADISSKTRKKKGGKFVQNSASSAFLTGIAEDDLSILTEQSEHDAESVAEFNRSGIRLTPLETRKYFGPSARQSFFAQTNYLSKQRSMTTLNKQLPTLIYKSDISIADEGGDYDLDDEEFDEMTQRSTSEILSEDMAEPSSPRSNYIFDCLEDRCNPRASHVIRKKLSTTLNLRHHGMGNKLAVHLAKAIREIPGLQCVDISDNGLSDEGLKPMLASILRITTLTELNVSENKIDGDSAESLAVYCASASCPLVKLTMMKADVDDFEGAVFVEGLQKNINLTDLDLSHNKLGTAENLNTVMPDLTTAPEAIAELLRMPTCKLQRLNVAWNCIRLDSAIDMASSLSINYSLTDLDLSYNSFGHHGGMALGDALIDNRSIKYLSIANNNIDASACFTICIGIQENLALLNVVMDGNPIGEAGAKALMQIPAATGNRTYVSARGCNTSLKDGSCWFDSKYPCRKYSLELSDPFQRSVAFQVLRIAANHQTFILQDVKYQHPPASKNGKPPQPEPINLIQICTYDKVKHFNAEQNKLYNHLKLIKEAASDMKKAKELFLEADIDGSNEIDKEEFKTLLSLLNIALTDAQVEDAMAKYDVDGQGTIELPEFLGFVRSLQHDCASRMKDMSETIVMGSADFNIKQERYVPPREGKLIMELLDGFLIKPMFQVVNNTDQDNMTAVAKAAGDTGNLLPFGFESMRIRLNEALEIYEAMLKDVGDKVKVLTKILPQISSPEEVRTMIKKITNNDVLEVQRIKNSMGQSIKPIWGMPNGYYNLDLTKDMDRICLSMLFEQSVTLASLRGGLCKIDNVFFGDTSQHQNWCCFRNEIFNNNPIKLTPQLFTPMPKSGRLSFDFSGGIRPVEQPQTISDKKFLKALVTANLIQPFERIQWESSLSSLWPNAVKVKEANKGVGRTIHEDNTERAFAIGTHVHEFYTRLPERLGDFLTCMSREQITVNLDDEDSVSEMQQQALLHDDDNEDDDLDDNDGSYNPPVVIKNDAPVLDTNKMTSAVQNLTQLKFRKIMSSHKISRHGKANKIVELMEDILGPYWIRCRHLSVLMEVFADIGTAEKTTYYGSYRSEIVVNLFHRVVDIHNIEQVMRHLLPFEAAAVICRIGRLNLFNPLKPEGGMELNLSIYEDRQVAKMILVLSANEPGDNLKEQKFRWDREMPFMPGWEVTQPWMSEDGVLKKGLFYYSYYTGEGRNLNGARADVNWRKALLKMVLIRESDLLYDTDPDVTSEVIRQKDLDVQEFMQLKKERFVNYLKFIQEKDIQAFELSTTNMS